MKLTDKEIDQLTAGMFIFIHATQMMVDKMVSAYEVIDKDSQQYRQLKKTMGKVAADMWLKKEERKIMLQAKGEMLHRWLDAAHKLTAATDKATEIGMMSKHDEASYVDVADGLINDTNMMCRLFLLMGNIHPNDYIKVESTLKLLWDKGHQPVSSELIDEFRMG